MKIRTCTVPVDLPRVDLLYDGITFRRAALLGNGGILGAGAHDAWVEIATRLRSARTYDAPAADVVLLAVYAPGHTP